MGEKVGEEVKPLTLEEDLKGILQDLEKIAKKLDIPMWQLLPVMTHREVVILNQQLKAVHDLLEKVLEKQKSEG